ncbi:3-dehydroquinate synthase [Parapedomonas caeni]
MTHAPAPRPEAGSESRIEVDLGPNSYPILIGAGLLNRIGTLAAPWLPRGKTVIVTDKTIADLYLDRVIRTLAEAGITAEPIVLPSGEGTKSFAVLEQVVERLLELGIERKDAVIALGGGVIGDLVGFATAILRRGCAFIQVPTTLLSQVDSSVGGKTGINSRHGKNLVGAFHQPKLVVIDTDLLDTLHRRELLAGYAEVVKYGLINDADFFAWLEAHGEALLKGDAAGRTHAIAVSCQAKATVVEQDEFETRGLRALLNLGHTFGHALEAELGYSHRLLHGEGVAIGMVLAFELSVAMGLCPAADLARVRDHLRAVGLPTSPADIGLTASGATLVAHMRQDKKMDAGRLAFILTHGIGKAFVTKDVDLGQVEALLDRHAADAGQRLHKH